VITLPAGRSARGELTRVDVAPAQVVAAAGTAVVTAARVGRLLGRTGWRIARQLPGARTVEREAQRLQTAAMGGARRWLQIPQTLPGMGNWPASPAEQRAVEMIRTVEPGTAPLRTAMSELLERSVEATRADTHEYLYGTIISQLVPDEARILAALADGARFAALDVVRRPRRGRSRTLLANAASVGRQAGLVSPESTPTYLTRLQSFDLVEFGPEDDTLAAQYDILAAEPDVRRVIENAVGRRGGPVKIERKTLRMSEFGHRFWAATDPAGMSP
jgi:Abortive infection alpha